MLNVCVLKVGDALRRCSMKRSMKRSDLRYLVGRMSSVFFGEDVCLAKSAMRRLWRLLTGRPTVGTGRALRLRNLVELSQLAIFVCSKLNKI